MVMFRLLMEGKRLWWAGCRDGGAGLAYPAMGPKKDHSRQTKIPSKPLIGQSLAFLRINRDSGHNVYDSTS